MNITLVTPNMITTIDALIRDAFTHSAHGYGNEAELVHALRNGQTTTIEWAVVDDDIIVGHALVSEALIGDNKGLVLAPLSVLTKRQKQGVGTMLMNEVNRFAVESDYTFISILGDAAYYNQFGYVPASQFDVHAPFEVPDEAFMLRTFKEYLPKQNVLVYAPEFGI